MFNIPALNLFLIAFAEALAFGWAVAVSGSSIRYGLKLTSSTFYGVCCSRASITFGSSGGAEVVVIAADTIGTIASSKSISLSDIPLLPPLAALGLNKSSSKSI